MTTEDPIELDAAAGSGCNTTTDAGCDSADVTSKASVEPLPGADGSAGCAPEPPDELSKPTQPPATVREFERALRGLGYTRMQAQCIARQGFNGTIADAETEPDPGDPDQLRDALMALARSLESRS